MNYKLITDDCLNAIRQIEDNSIDNIITDPPAGIAFMNKDWDKNKGGRDNWISWLSSVMRECLRVLKPGGHIVVWALPRTSHWTATAIENAGFEIRDAIHYLKESNTDANTFIESLSPDQLQLLETLMAQQSYDGPFYHVFGSGFPKSHNVGKAVSKIANESCSFNGYGTALKPSVEHWILAMKPIEGTYAQNALKWGVAGLNINDGRVGVRSHENGRWPAHLVHDGSDEIKDLFPATKSAAGKCKYVGTKNNRWIERGGIAREGHKVEWEGYGDSGSSARFFYTAKPSSSERDAGCEELEEKEIGMSNGAQNHGKEYNECQSIGLNKVKSHCNTHPTVKSISLMRWLVRLVKSPTNGIILDPFSGSGSTGCACALEDCNYIGIEQNAEYNEIAHLRIEHWKSVAESQQTLYITKENCDERERI